MATTTSVPFTSPATAREGGTGLIAEFKAFWNQVFDRIFDPYRPELHYMRGPGPAWRAKHLGQSRHSS